MVDSSVEIARTRMRPARTASRRGKYIQSRRALKVGLAFISPWILGFLAFTVIPLATSLYYSFTDYNGLSVSNWVGFRNYEQIFTKDPYIRVALYNTLYLAVFGVVLGGVLAFVIALLLNQKVRGIGIYRTLFYLPTMLPIVVSAFVFTLVLDPSTGVLNKVLGWFGVTGPGWLFSTTWSKPALIILGLWGVGNSVIIYLAGLQDIPKHLIEAATVDGAGWWARLRNVTMPLLSPIIFFNLLLAIIYAFQNFISVFYLTSNGGGSTAGGPANSTMTWGLLIYEDAFVNSQIGYASAMSWLMLIFVLIITALMFGMSKRWVYYEGAGPR
ncbi:MAG TPA: sugar ABC transporter permease [Mycobacteriales bacterium]|nr:sugar ABC transporter permease [Mycobacteriales bacterium]